MTAEQLRALLLKYIKHVGLYEGTVFLDEQHRDDFTPKEYDMLKILDAESIK